MKNIIMGTTNKIQETNIEVIGLKCRQCQQPFTEEDENERNFEVIFDTTNGVDLEETRGDKYRLTVYVREITHKLNSYKYTVQEKPYKIEREKTYFGCPDIEECLNCKEKGLAEKMLETPFDKKTAKGGDYFCNEECQKEYAESKPQTAWEYCVNKIIQDKIYGRK